MFGHRVDGKKVKKMDVISKAEPFFMPMRIDAVNYIKVEIPCAPLDDFIARERKLGNNYSYFHVALTTIVRLMYTRPKHNRFVVMASFMTAKVFIFQWMSKKNCLTKART